MANFPLFVGNEACTNSVMVCYSQLWNIYGNFIVRSLAFQLKFPRLLNRTLAIFFLIIHLSIFSAFLGVHQRRIFTQTAWILPGKPFTFLIISTSLKNRKVPSISFKGACSAFLLQKYF